MMSGRGLGHTGWDAGQVESILGFTAALDPDRFHQVLAAEGLVLAGQSDTLVPADRRLYALRDATATVTSIPLIASSIMSKKLAEDLDGWCSMSRWVGCLHGRPGAPDCWPRPWSGWGGARSDCRGGPHRHEPAARD